MRAECVVSAPRRQARRGTLRSPVPPGERSPSSRFLASTKNLGRGQATRRLVEGFDNKTFRPSRVSVFRPGVREIIRASLEAKKAGRADEAVPLRRTRLSG